MINYSPAYRIKRLAGTKSCQTALDGLYHIKPAKESSQEITAGSLSLRLSLETPNLLSGILKP